MSAPSRRRWSLRAQLVAGTAAVLGAALLAVIVVASISLGNTVQAVVGAQLTASMSALEHSVDKYRGNDTRGPELETPQEVAKGFGKPLTDFVGQSTNTLIAIVQDGEVIDASRFGDSGGEALSTEQTQAVAAAAAAGEGTREIDIPSLGHYRVAVASSAPGEYLVAAVPLAFSDAAEAGQVATNVLVALLALAAAVASAAILGKLLFRSMERVVEVAETVSRTPLASGDGGIAVRVDAADADPRSDIGQLGAAMNSLLDHVDDALVARAAADRRMRRFVTDASHELRTPLAAIQGYAELTRQESELLPETTEYSLARIESEAKRMSSLVSQLLLLARLDEGHDLQIEEVDLADLVDTAVNDARASSPEHAWRSEVPEYPVIVLGDRERLHQLVVNLLSNAALHTPAGTTVTAGIRADGASAILLTVRDTGPGIDSALIPVLFERFARADTARTRAAGGTGLGLAIAHSIVEAHGGVITASSSAAGAVFSVRLPGAGDPAAPARA
ncbi:sensor histidine kinase [Microterricola viridarii]|uniref:histidine kinase n=1 Tax=Microterricola viridarii TaxID=412690 RepID=A0A1H1M755_9MICO|nr:ATP-binding protein [Microterricola viridarii]SDR82352.1 two-component system, OmpR family, sensor histidine kinase TrcS [Microterricola viridarii]